MSDQPIRKDFDPAELSIVPNEPRTVVSWITTDVVDHVGDVVLAEGVDYTSAFLDKNPVVMAVHDYQKWPVGTADHIKLKKGPNFTGLMGKMRFDTDADAERLFGLVERRVVRGQSIGFVPPVDLNPKEWGPPTAEELKRRPDWKDAARIIRRCVLVEWSFVPIPMNRESLVTAVQKGLALPSYLEREAKQLMEPETPVQTKGSVPFHAYPASDAAWDAAKARKQFKEHATGDDGEIDFAKYELGFAYCDESAKDTEGGYKYPHHYIEGGKITTCKAGLAAAVAACHGARSGSTPEGADEALAHLKKHYTDLGMDWPEEGKGLEAELPSLPVEPKAATSKPEDDGDGDRDDDGDEDEESLKKGDYVKFCAGTGRKGVGRVVSIHKDGDMVPDVNEDIMGTPDEPAARVRCYKAMRDGHVPTDHHVGAMCKHLAKTEDLKPPKDEPKRPKKGVRDSLPPLPVSTALPPLPVAAPLTIHDLATALSPENITRGIEAAKNQLLGRMSF